MIDLSMPYMNNAQHLTEACCLAYLYSPIQSGVRPVSPVTSFHGPFNKSFTLYTLESATKHMFLYF